MVCDINERLALLWERQHIQIEASEEEGSPNVLKGPFLFFGYDLSYPGPNSIVTALPE